MMDVVHLEPEMFDRFWKPHRNILVLELADRVDTQTPSLTFFRNKYSRGQVYMVAKARTEGELAEVVASRGGEMLSLLHAEEASRFADIVALSPNEVLAKGGADSMGGSRCLAQRRKACQAHGRVLVDRPSIDEAQRGRQPRHSARVFIHSEPYVSTDQLSLEHVLRRRDAVTKHVQGPTPGSFMATERRFIPAYEEMEFDGHFALEVRGLWKMENDFMGGPFYSLTVVDEAVVGSSPWTDTRMPPTSTRDPTSGKSKAWSRRSTLLDTPEPVAEEAAEE